MKTYRGSVLLLVGVLLLAAYAYFFEYRQSELEEEKKAAKAQLVKLETQHIDRFVLAPKESDAIELRRDTGGWKVLKPSAYKGDQGNIEQFIDELVEFEASTEVEEGPQVDWALFGLDSPLAVLTLGAGSGAERRIEVSAKTNFEGRVYVRQVGEDKVLLADKVWLDAANRDLFFFRNKQVFLYDRKDVTELTWTNENESFVVQKKGESWVSVEHPDWELAENEVENLLSQIQQITAKSIQAEGTPRAPAKLGLDKPKLRIEVGLMGDKQWQAKAGETPDHKFYLWASEPNRTVEIEGPNAAELFAISLDKLRDRKSVFEFDSSKVQRIEYKAGDSEPLKMAELGGEQWKLKESGQPLEKDKVQELLSALSDLEVEIFDDPEALQEKGAVLDQKVKLFDSTGEVLIALEWGAPYQKAIDGKNDLFVPIRSQTSKSLLSVPAEVLKKLDLKSLEKAAEVNDT